MLTIVCAVAVAVVLAIVLAIALAVVALAVWSHLHGRVRMVTCWSSRLPRAGRHVLARVCGHEGRGRAAGGCGGREGVVTRLVSVRVWSCG